MKYQIDHDIHIHSHLSLCSNDPRQTTQAILNYAEKNGLKTVCVTDHFWDETVPGASGWYAAQNYAHVTADLPLPQQDGVRFLFGCETELKRDLTLGISREMMDRFDFIIIPTTHMHMSEFVMDSAAGSKERAMAYVNRLDAVLGMDLPFGKIGIAHLATSLITPSERSEEVISLISDEELCRLFKKAADVGVGIELNADDVAFGRQAPETVASTLRLFSIAKKMGCKFYLGSDAHHPDAFSPAIRDFGKVIDRLGLTEDDKFII